MSTVSTVSTAPAQLGAYPHAMDLDTALVIAGRPGIATLAATLAAATVTHTAWQDAQATSDQLAGRRGVRAARERAHDLREAWSMLDVAARGRRWNTWPADSEPELTPLGYRLYDSYLAQFFYKHDHLDLRMVAAATAAPPGG